VSGRTAEEALAAAKKFNAAASADEIQPSSGTLAVTFLMPQGEVWMYAGDRPLRFRANP